MTEKNENSLEDAFAELKRKLLGERGNDGHWTGELSASALSTATAISALSFLLDTDSSHHRDEISRQIECGLRWLVANQNQDGGWGDTEKNYSNISTTMLVMAAFHAAGKTVEYSDLIAAAKGFVECHGGVAGIRKRYGDDKTFAVPILANAAMAGLVEWKEVGVLPFEAACVPQRFYHWLRLPVVSYAIPALVAIGQAKFHFDPPINPVTRLIRKFSIERSLKVLGRMQPQSGGYLEAIPLTSFVCMALIKCGRADHAVVQNGIRFLLDSFRSTSDGTGTWPIDTNLATWVTTLSVNALCSDTSFQPEDDWEECLDWLLDCQYKTVHPFTGAAPGGWGWSNLSGAVPDADDTPGALIALRNLFDRMRLNNDDLEKIKQAAVKGCHWLLGLQNRDGGWPTFCRGWGRLPFDRSGNDLTAHAIRALIAWEDEISGERVKNAIRRGFAYLDRNQEEDGSWLPLWFGNQDQIDDINPFYGTAKVLHAYYESGRLHTKSGQNGLKWLRENQNPDGGWGGGKSVQFSFSGSTSSVEETSLSTDALLLDEDQRSLAAANAGLDWLCAAVKNDAIEKSTPIGFYFAKLWYYEKLYPLIFATSALGAGKSKQAVAEFRRENKLDSIYR